MKLVGFFQAAMVIYVNQTIVLFHIYMGEYFSHTFFHHATLYSFVFSFDSLFDVRKKMHIFIRHSPFTRFFFLFLLFFLNTSQYFCSNDIIRIHHAFSLLFSLCIVHLYCRLLVFVICFCNIFFVTCTIAFNYL